MDTTAPANFDTDQPRDIAAVAAGAWPRRELTPPPRGRAAGFQVIFQKGVLEAIHAHGRSITDIEICGFLVGNVFHDASGPFLHVVGSIEGRHATHHAAQVTFTSATWDYAHEVLERDHPGERIVGWYHTHPDFGVFLSGMDLFIQDNFFNLPWQVALVYDPVRGDEGVFVWRNAASERVPHLVHGGAYTDGGAYTHGGAYTDGGAVLQTAAPAEDSPPQDPALASPRKPGMLRRLLHALERFFDE
jgi:proteasome lid subunit RPN8/RPN11